MLKAFAIVLAVAWVAAASAQPSAPPVELEPDGDISLGIGQTKTFRFDAAFARAGTATQGIAELAPQTDHILTITGLAAGETKMYIFSDKGDRIYSATLTITPENGHIVRIYGGITKAQDGDSKDFVGVWCTPTFCGRADKDVSPVAPTPGVVGQRSGPGGSSIRPARTF